MRCFVFFFSFLSFILAWHFLYFSSSTAFVSVVLPVQVTMAFILLCTQKLSTIRTLSNTHIEKTCNENNYRRCLMKWAKTEYVDVAANWQTRERDRAQKMIHLMLVETLMTLQNVFCHTKTEKKRRMREEKKALSHTITKSWSALKRFWSIHWGKGKPVQMLSALFAQSDWENG